MFPVYLDGYETNKMKRLSLCQFTLFAIVLILTAGSCKKSPAPRPEPLNESNVLLTLFPEPLIINQPGSHFSTDLDRDGVADLKFGLSVLTESGRTDYFYAVDPLNENVQVVATSMLDAYSYPVQTDILDYPVPSNERRWTNSKLILLEKWVESSKTERIGMFNGANPQYLGVRTKKNGQYHYSWVEIRHKENSGLDQIIICAMGFHRLSGFTIKAGAV